MRARGSGDWPNDAWTAAIYAADRDAPLGAGVVIDDRRVLTCRHVIESAHGRGAVLLVRFPKAGVPRTAACRVEQVRRAKVKEDVVVLQLAEPVPPEVTPAVLRAPRPSDLVGDRWWAFGFPQDAELGTDAYGVVGTALSWGWVRLDTRSRYVVKPGFSGAGLWSTDFQAVVGLVGRARSGGENRGDAQALTMHEIVQAVPEENLAVLAAWSLEAVGESALEAWGWSLDTDEEAVRHWRPRARGVSKDSEHGYRFRGRTQALSVIVRWLERSVPDRRLLVVTGSPGVGKSAVLGRVVTTADAGVRDALPADDHNVRAPIGSIACAVHVKGKTALDVATEIARAASVRVPRAIDDLAPALAGALKQRPGRTFNLVVDALDEATNPAQARLIISALLVPIAQTCGRLGAQVVVGTRRVDDGGDLLKAFGLRVRIVDLDREEFFAEADLADYALATLSMVGDERAGNPYADVDMALPVARRIAALADRNFLVAGLIARGHGLYDTEPVDPEKLAFTATVDAALAEYVDRLPPVGRVSAAMLLTALAYAQAPGLSVELWQIALASLGANVVRSELARFVGSSAANFLVESSSAGDAHRYRLFHQALDDALLRARDREKLRESDEQAIARDLIAHGQRSGWAVADSYLLRALPSYADRAGMIDVLLNDDFYLLYADLPRLIQLAGHARTDSGRARTRLLYLTPQAIGAPAADRAALFSVTAELDQLGQAFATWRGVPYRARWAVAAGRVERAVLEGHAGSVLAMCPVTVDGRTLIATASEDRSVRLWDPVTGRHELTLAGQRRAAQAMATVPVRGRVLLATGDREGAIMLWDPATGQPLGALTSSGPPIRALCTVNLGSAAMLASAGDDAAIRLWNLGTGRQVRTLSGHTKTVSALAAFSVNGRLILASGGHDQTARFWNPLTGARLGSLDQIDWVRAVCPVALHGQVLIAIASYRTVHLWNPGTGRVLRSLDGHTRAIRALAPLKFEGRKLLASAGDDSDIRVWDPATGECERRLTGHTAAVSALSQITVADDVLLASASHDRTARLWDLTADRRTPIPGGRSIRVDAACPVTVDNRQLVATAAADNGTVRLWDPATGAVEGTIDNRTHEINGLCGVKLDDAQLIATANRSGIVKLWHTSPSDREVLRISQEGWVRAMCPVHSTDGRTLLATAGYGRAVIRLWRLPSGKRVRSLSLWSAQQLQVHARGINTLQSMTLNGAVVLATAGDDWRVLLWDLKGHHLADLWGHQGPVRALCAVEVDGRPRLVSGSDDQTLRVWDPMEGTCETVLSGHTDQINAIGPVVVDGQPMIASASHDRTVKVWDLAGRSLALSIPVHHPALTCVQASGLLIVGLTAGILAVDLNPASNELAYFRDIRSG